MDHSTTIVELVSYEIWCNRKLADFMPKLSDSECHHDFGFGLRTPHHTLFHIADVMRGWSGCIAPVIQQPVWLPYDKSMPVPEVCALLLRAGVAFEDASRAAHADGVLGEARRLNQLFHLITHGTHHRGQLLSMFTLLGYEHPFEGGDFGGWSSSSRA